MTIMTRIGVIFQALVMLQSKPGVILQKKKITLTLYAGLMFSAEDDCDTPRGHILCTNHAVMKIGYHIARNTGTTVENNSLIF